MTRICREAEASLDYYAMFKNILKAAPMPMSPLESLASSAVRTAHKVTYRITVGVRVWDQIQVTSRFCCSSVECQNSYFQTHQH